MRKIICIFFMILVLTILPAGCSSANVSSQSSQTVTFSIRCDTAVANGMANGEKWEGIIPEDGCILPETEMEITEGETVFDVLCRVRDEYGIHMEYSGTNQTTYIEGIGNLYERDCGRWSGWMYCVNGEYPDVGCGEYELEDGDDVDWNYTCDLGIDLDADREEAEEWKETHE